MFLTELLTLYVDLTAQLNIHLFCLTIVVSVAFFILYEGKAFSHTLGRWQSKTPILSRNVDKKSLETEFLIAICRHTDDKWQSKTLFLSIFYLRSSIVDSFFRLLPTRCESPVFICMTR